MSRGLADFAYKSDQTLSPSNQLLIANPKITCTERSPEDQYLFLASDGIYDVLGNDDIAAIVYALDNQERDGAGGERGDYSQLPAYCDCVISEAMLKGTRDNLSTVLISLSKPTLSKQLFR